MARVLVVWLTLALPTGAEIIVVDALTGLEPDTCSLGEAIENANDGAATNPDCASGEAGSDTIQLATEVILVEPLPDVTSEIVIEGNERTIERFANATEFTVLRVLSGGDLALHDTTVSGGLSLLGGGIYNDGNLTLVHSTVSDNVAQYGGGIYNQSGTVVLTRSTVSGNTATDGRLSGPLTYYGGAGGGLHNAAGNVTLTNSTVSGNTSTGYYGASGAGIYNQSGTVTLTYSTVSRNQALDTSPATEGYNGRGGGLFNGTGQLFLTNVTVSSNVVSGGGSNYTAGIFNRAGGVVTLRSSTIFGNQRRNLRSFGSVYATDTLLGGSLLNCNAAIVSNGGNLADDSSCGPDIPSTLGGVNPTLADNGGPTETHSLGANSSAVDRSGSCGLDFDQRSNPRDDGYCDTGAYELECSAADGFIVFLEMDSVTFSETVEACLEIQAGNDYVVDAVGDLTLRSGSRVILGGGFSVEQGGLLSVEIDPDLQMRAPPIAPKVAFATSTSSDGDLGGLSGADTTCNLRAAAGGLSGTFKAWLSDSSCAVAEACRGFTKSDGPYVRTDGERIADDWDDLTGGSLDLPLLYDEFENPVTTAKTAWTATASDGSSSGILARCDDWESGSVLKLGSYGCADSTGVWSSCSGDACSASRRLYCFEQ